MRSFMRCALVAVMLGGVFTSSLAYAVTLGELLAGGAKKLTKPEMQALISGATMSGTQGGNFPDTTFKTVYRPDGTVRGDAWNKGKWFSNINGTWSVNDAGQLCSTLRNDTGGNIVGCFAYYSAGGKYFAARTDSPSDKVEERTIAR